MKIFLTQLQAYNAMFKLLDSYYKKTKSDDFGALLGIMSFLKDGTTADSAVWGDWIKAVDDKKTLTKQEAFEGVIRFLEKYRGFALSADIDKVINKLRSAKNCSDIRVLLVKKWNRSLKDALNEPEGTREYRSFGDPMENIPPIRGFNTVYKLLDYYCKQKESEELTCMAENMLFLPDGGTADPAAWDNWMEAISNKLASTKQEVFESIIRFLETYGDQVSSSEAKSIASELRSAKNCDDFSAPFVELWNFCLVEALNEPGGARKYLQFTKE